MFLFNTTFSQLSFRLIESRIKILNSSSKRLKSALEHWRSCQLPIIQVLVVQDWYSQCSVCTATTLAAPTWNHSYFLCKKYFPCLKKFLNLFCLLFRLHLVQRLFMVKFNNKVLKIQNIENYKNKTKKVVLLFLSEKYSNSCTISQSAKQMFLSTLCCSVVVL